MPPRFARREREIAETKRELAESESLRYSQRAELLGRRLREVETRLRESEDAAEAERQTASQHAEILAKVFAAGILVDYCKFIKSTTSPLRLREWLATGSRLCTYKDGYIPSCGLSGLGYRFTICRIGPLRHAALPRSEDRFHFYLRGRT